MKSTKKVQKATDSVFEIEKSTEPGVVFEMYGYGVTCFDPAHVDKKIGAATKEWIVGGGTTLSLTAADVKMLRAALK